MSESHSTKLAQIDVRLQLLNEERLALLNDRQALITEHEAELAQNFNLHASPESKVELFLFYFKGRNDVYPFRWESKNGRSGYSPACWNEWQPKICNKPKISCTECKNQNFKLPDYQAVYGHLKGIQTIGIYPLLNDNSTFILAADFDKDDWFEAVTAFSLTCESLGISYLLEGSRSGNGGHVPMLYISTNSISCTQHGRHDAIGYKLISCDLNLIVLKSPSSNVRAFLFNGRSQF